MTESADWKQNVLMCFRNTVMGAQIQPLCGSEFQMVGVDT